MVLSSFAIKELLESKRLVIDPLETGQIQPASVDLKISDEIMVPKGRGYETVKKNEILLPPKTHVLVRTEEHVELPNDVGGIVKLRSSLSRIGVMLNNAGWIDPGFKGTLTLSVFNPNDSPLEIKRGTRFFQLVLLRLDRESEGYSGKYLGQKGVTGNKGV